MKKFFAIIGNPPYQGDNHQQLYPDFYLESIKAADNVELIFPTGWQEPKSANNLGKLNKEEVKADSQIVLINNVRNAFEGVTGAEWTNILLWKKGYNNGLDGKQRVLTDGKDEQIKKLAWDKADIERPQEIRILAEIVMNTAGFMSMSDITSKLKPYGLRTDSILLSDNELQNKYNLPPIRAEKSSDDDIKLYGRDRGKLIVKFLSSTYPLPKIPSTINQYKVLTGENWGGYFGKYIGGAYSDIVIAGPNEVCTEHFIETGGYNTRNEAVKTAKYMMSKFVRALCFMNKFSCHNNQEMWKAVPIQTFEEPWWDTDDIDEIDEHLFEKYSVPEEIREYVRTNIQPRTVQNIINYD